MLRMPLKGMLLRMCVCTAIPVAAFLWWDQPTKTRRPVQAGRAADFSAPGATNTVPAVDSSVRPTAEDEDFKRLAALAHSSSPDDSTLMSALESLASAPANAITIYHRLILEFPDRASEFGTILIGALVRGSAYTAALELAQTGPEANRVEWIALVLSHWAQSRPEDAKLIADVLREKAVSTSTFELVAKSWAASTPEQLASYALSLPPGEYRSIAFTSVLDPLILQNPAAVSAALPQLTEPVERDQALAILAARTDTAFRPISQGILWAEAISNVDLRRTALAQVIREWFDHDPGAAGRYLLTSSVFNSEQRQSLIASMQPPPDPL